MRSPRLTRLAVVCAALSLGGSIPSPARAAAPADEAMQLLWELNRARSGPPAWALEHGLDGVPGGDGLPTTLERVRPKPPLAASSVLFASAQAKAQEFVDHDYFGPQSPVTGWPNHLVREVFGYPLPRILFLDPCDPCVFEDDGDEVESLATSLGPEGGASATAIGALSGLLVDAGTLRHRIHLLGIGGNPSYRTPRFMGEAGIGHAQETENGITTHYWVVHTGLRTPAVVFLTGVAFHDANANDLYDAGEGLAAVTVSASALSTTTDPAGGWSIPVTDGSYDVACSGAGFAGTARAEGVVVTDENREIDCRSGVAQARVDFVPEPSARFAGVAVAAVLAALARLGRTHAARRPARLHSGGCPSSRCWRGSATSRATSGTPSSATTRPFSSGTGSPRWRTQAASAKRARGTGARRAAGRRGPSSCARRAGSSPPARST